ncbi:caspase-8-like [Acipenser oxyrinchus oxyrinchus]|uniref:Caspase-8 n=1 Tax=Acipenser oxyrinchus oxyrinchus TaxID=40147 RepID=A0AAD8G5V9_ACIOX|nr:caspase-8-like [Acipenser oxyrinchus oxyrinchus]
MDRSVLHEIDEDLGSEEVVALKFLCRDHIPKKKQQAIRDAKDLFIKLREQGKLGDDDQDIVPELLYTIRRFDLLKLCGTSKQEVQNRLDMPGKISEYRKMLYDISENVTTNEVKAIKSLLTEELRRCTLKDNATMLDVFAEMEKMEILGEDKLNELEYVCGKTNKDLVQRIEEYKQKQAAVTQTPDPTDTSRSAAPVPPSRVASREDPTRQPPQHSQQFGNHTRDLPGQRSSQNGEVLPSLSLDAGPVSVASLDNKVDAYKMTSRPRGYCVIINNKDFEKARLKVPSRPLNDREGTDIDAVYLTKVFKWLHFEVVQYNDQTAVEIRSTMEEYRQQDHSNRDCFVCCILSHGLKGAIEGTDGSSVSIREITSYFTGSRCPSLKEKPKVFFIQACQGQKTQIAVKIHADGEGPASQPETEPEPEADAGLVQVDTIPNDSDFLLGMATMEDYLSYRSVSKGSFYMQALCRNLELLCPSNEDILSILTTVNRDVSSENFMNRENITNNKQMPEPRYTLTKKLFFPTS